jgi:hypothetical protein
MASVIAETCLQAIDDLGFEAAHVIRRFIAEPAVEFFGQANADHPRPVHQGKASDDGSGREAENQSDEGGNCGAHGNTPPIRNSTIMLIATERTAATDHLTTITN